MLYSEEENADCLKVRNTPCCTRFCIFHNMYNQKIAMLMYFCLFSKLINYLLVMTRLEIIRLCFCFFTVVETKHQSSWTTYFHCLLGPNAVSFDWKPLHTERIFFLSQWFLTTKRWHYPLHLRKVPSHPKSGRLSYPGGPPRNPRSTSFQVLSQTLFFSVHILQYHWFA